MDTSPKESSEKADDVRDARCELSIEYMESRGRSLRYTRDLFKSSSNARGRILGGVIYAEEARTDDALVFTWTDA